MKIVFTVATYYPKRDGVQYVTQYQAEQLAIKGYEVVVITSQVPNTKDSEIHNNVRIERVNAFNKNTLHIGDKRNFIEKVKNECDDALALITICLQSYASDWLLNDLDSIKTRKILIMHGMHNFSWNLIDIINPKNFFVRLVRNIRWGLFYSVNRKKFMKYNIITHLHECDDSFKYFSKIKDLTNKVLFNSVENDFFVNNSEVNKKSYFINVANFGPRKNQAACIKAIYFITNSDARLKLLGSSENKYYRKLLKINEKYSFKFGINKVEFLIGMSREKIKNHLSMATAFILTSTWEAFPISIIESMASKTPFISTNTGIIRYLPGGITVNSFEDLKYWMQLLYNNPEISRKIGLMGFNYAKENFNQIVQVENLIKYIEGK